MTNATNTSGPAWATDVFLPQVLERTGDMIAAPIEHPEMFWIVVPLVISLIILIIYFIKHEKEELGWNTALSNSLLLVFVSIDLLRYVYTNPYAEQPIILGNFALPLKTIIALVVLFEGFSLAFADFFHFLPRKVAFFISSIIPVNLTAYVATTIVYTTIPFDIITITAAIFLFVILITILEAAKHMHAQAKKKPKK